MMDRTPTKVLANGAIRYGVYDEAGNFLRYEYIKPEDMPTQEGAPFCKATMLNDETAALLGLAATAVPNDALKAIQNQFFSLFGSKALIKITAKALDGTPIPNMEISVSGGTSGKKYITNSEGFVVADSSTTSTTFSMGSGYADMSVTTKTISTPLGAYTSVELTASFVNFVKYTSSNTIKISPFCKKLHVTAVGGGAGGGAGKANDYDGYGGGGGGGGNCVVANNVAFLANVDMSVIVGSGGNGGVGVNGNYGAGSNGGSSSFAGVGASGGLAGSAGTAGGGNGTGGSGATTSSHATLATAGTVLGFSSETQNILYGGGGGGGGFLKYTLGYSSSNGGGYGGNGTYQGIGLPGTDGYGGGGGGGGTAVTNNYTTSYNGGKGGSGCIAIRMEH